MDTSDIFCVSVLLLSLPEQLSDWASSVAMTWMMRPMRRRNISLNSLGWVLMLIARYTMISWGRMADRRGRKEIQQQGATSEGRQAVSDLCEDGHADVVVASLVDESSQLVRRDGSRDGFFSGLGRETDGQVLLVSQQVRAGLQGAVATVCNE